jgi:hypothetical protein
MVRPDSASVPADRRGLHTVLLALSLGLTGWAVYINSLTNPFVYDDYRLVVENAALAHPGDLWGVVWHDITRPVVNLSYALDAALWGIRPLGFHLTNVLLHAINVVLVFVVATAMDVDVRPSDPQTSGPSDSRTLGPSDPRVRRWGLALIAAVLFAVHPMLSQAVGYVSARADLLCATFVLLTFLLARRYLLNGGLLWAGLSAVAWLLAIGSKEPAAMFPFVLLVYHRLVLPGTASRGRAAILYAPMLALVVVAAGVRLWVLRHVEYQTAPLDWRLALVALDASVGYLRLMLWPSGQTVFHALAAIDSWFDVRLLLAGAVVAVVAVGSWWLRRIDRIIPYGVAWFALFLLPSSVLFVLGRGEALAEHRVYLPSIGLFLAGGALVSAGLRRSRIEAPALRWMILALATVLVLQLGVRTMIRNAVWSNPVGLWQESVAQAPEHWLPHMMLAETLRLREGCAAAVREYDTSLRLRPQETEAYPKLGGCLIDLRRYDEAAAVFSDLIKIAPLSAQGPTGLAIVEMMQGHPERSREQLLDAIRREPDAVMPRQLLATLEEPADPATALRLCREIRQLAPGTPDNDACIRIEQRQAGAPVTTSP